MFLITYVTIDNRVLTHVIRILKKYLQILDGVIPMYDLHHTFIQ